MLRFATAAIAIAAGLVGVPPSVRGDVEAAPSGNRVPIRVLVPSNGLRGGPKVKMTVWTHITGQQVDGKWENAKYDDHFAAVGDVLVFSHGATHDVVKMPSASCGVRNGDETGFERNVFAKDAYPGKGSLYTVTPQDLELGAIYFGCSYPWPRTWGHCDQGQRVKVNVVAKEAKPVVPEGCFNQEATLPCTWFAADTARCGMVPGAREQCPTECATSMKIRCSWFQEDAKRCDMVKNSATLCRAQCGGDCGVDNVGPVFPSTGGTESFTLGTEKPTGTTAAPPAQTTKTMNVPATVVAVVDAPAPAAVAARGAKSSKVCGELDDWIKRSAYAKEHGVCAKSMLLDVPAGCVLRHTCPPQEAKCHHNHKQASAAAVCEANGARLCSLAEFQGRVSQGTGCQIDNRRTWTATACDDGNGTGRMVIKGNGSGEGRCMSVGDPAALASVRCCADVAQ